MLLPPMGSEIKTEPSPKYRVRSSKPQVLAGFIVPLLGAQLPSSSDK